MAAWHVGRCSRRVHHPGRPHQPTISSPLQVRLSVVEIYCERILDLLDPTGARDNLPVKQSLTRGVFVDGA
jgi:hypothetical protein